MKSEYLLYRTAESSAEMYADYVDNCEANGNTPQGDHSDDYYDYISRCDEMWAEDFRWELEHSAPSGKVVVTGTIGGWRGRFDIEPKVFENLYDAVMACCRGLDRVEVVQRRSTIEVRGAHHDGNNSFSVNLLNDRGIFTANGDLSNRRYHQTLRGHIFGWD